MSSNVNLLLLLSALLSALTGVGGTVRAQDRAQSVAEGSVVAGRVAQVPRLVTIRPSQMHATLTAAARAGIAVVFALLADEPAFATRRRE